MSRKAPLEQAILSLYIGQLLLPAAVLADLGWVWSSGYFAKVMVGAAAVGLTAGIWLLGGISVLALLMKRGGAASLTNKSVGNWLLLIYVTVALLTICEVTVRLMEPPPLDRSKFLRSPGSNELKKGDARITPGSTGPKNFRVNELGLRGPSLPKVKDLYRIIAVGGSTTESYWVDDAESWPQVLMDLLNNEHKRPVWIANAGFSGHTAVHSLALLKSVPVLRQSEMLIFMVGMNDFQATLEREGASTQTLLEKSASDFLAPPKPNTDKRPARHGPLLYQSHLYALARSVVAPDDLTGKDWYGLKRRHRTSAKIVAMPHLSAGLAEYRSRIAAIGRECASLGVRCLFVTQPTMWSDSLPQDLQSLLWFGWVGPVDNPRGFVSISELTAGMATYNRTLLETCAENGLECYDLAAVIPKNTSSMFDDCHFNESGSRLVAQRLAEYILSKQPL